MCNLAIRTRKKNFLKFRLAGAASSCRAMLQSQDLSPEVKYHIAEALDHMKKALKLWKGKVPRR